MIGEHEKQALVQYVFSRNGCPATATSVMQGFRAGVLAAIEALADVVTIDREVEEESNDGNHQSAGPLPTGEPAADGPDGIVY